MIDFVDEHGKIWTPAETDDWLCAQIDLDVMIRLEEADPLQCFLSSWGLIKSGLAT
jgi:hypothetical protein